MIKSIIANFRKPTTEAALGSLAKTLEQLDAVVKHENALADYHAVERAKHDAAEDVAMVAADRASRIATRLAALLA
jgi:hypothetical protein